MIALSKNNTSYVEDISTTASGSLIVNRPARVYSITVTSDTTGVGIVSFSDNDDSYSSSSKTSKVTINGVDTKTIIYPYGKTLTAGLCATANKSSMNVEVVYE